VVGVLEAPAALEDADLVALLGEPQGGDAAAEARADDQPVNVEVRISYYLLNPHMG
jgi:hypothetical protein